MRLLAHCDRAQWAACGVADVAAAATDTEKAALVAAVEILARDRARTARALRRLAQERDGSAARVAELERTVQELSLAVIGARQQQQVPAAHDA